MYHLPYFKDTEDAVVLAFMKQYPFAVLIGISSEQQPVATQVPLLFVEREGHLFLRGHIMKGTDHYSAFEKNKEVLVLFTGPHTYVSASWYVNQQQASTWNYMTVHAKGTLSFLGDEDLLSLLEELTSTYEKDPASPSQFKNLPEAYVMQLSKAIIAFEIRVSSLEHVFKLSQNKEVASIDAIIKQLEGGDANAKAVASEMRKRKDKRTTT